MSRTNKPNKPSPTESLEKILSVDLANSNLTVCLASTRKDEDVPVFARLQLSDNLTDDFREVVQTNLQRLNKELTSQDLVIRPYEAGAKLDSHEVEHVDISAEPFIAKQLEALSSVADVSVFQHSQEFIDGLHFYVIVLQPPQQEAIYCLRSYSPKKELGRSALFAAIFEAGSGQFDKIIKPAFLFDEHLDCVVTADTLFILNKDAFQKIFRFFEMVRKAAQETLSKIMHAVPIANFAEFAEACEAHLHKLAKLNNIARKPYLNTLSMADIKRVKTKCGLKIKIVKKDGKEMLLFDKNDRWSILRLLDDDYLASVMTGSNYEANSKRPIQ
jgi:hypothetical protein